MKPLTKRIHNIMKRMLEVAELCSFIDDAEIKGEHSKEYTLLKNELKQLLAEEELKMAQEITMKEAYKLNLIELAKHHRKFCEGEDCNISLILLLTMAERLGIIFSEEEKELFV